MVMNNAELDSSAGRGIALREKSSQADAVNRMVSKSVIRKPIPIQRDLLGKKIGDQKSYYEEIKEVVTYRPTHHKLNAGRLHFFIYPTNFAIREYQLDIVRKSLFQNVLCAIPTGMGKTFIASAVMLNFFNWSMEGKIIFTAPTRPLVAQQIKACLGITGIPHDQTAILLDKSRKNREQIWDEKRVFFTTPQVVENDLKRGVLDPKSIICLVVDEAHRATGSYAYTNIVQFIGRFNTSIRILALTATPGANLEAVQEVVKNLCISKIETRTEESLDLARYMKPRHQKKVEIDLIGYIEDIIEKLGIAIKPVLEQAVELGIYEECKPSQINAFKAMQQSQKIVANPGIPEGIKWRNFFILQLLNHVGQMLKRVKIYGIRTFYSYFNDKYKEFTVKYDLGKSKNKTAAEFYYNPILKSVINQCEELLRTPKFISHGKLKYMQDELDVFFKYGKSDSRVIIFTELRESALEIVKFIDEQSDPHIKPHIFIGQSKGKEGFDEVSFIRKNGSKGRKKADRFKRLEEYKTVDEERKEKKKQEQLERGARRTGSSEEAQLNGMTQKQQKQVIQDFKDGQYNVLVCTSIGEEGLDIGEVDLIICYDTTGSPIKNIQRMGRTGRKRAGEIVLLFSGNESSKFEQAMKDYYNLQRLISQDLLHLKKSDRIVPKEIDPICRKEFITVNEEDHQLTNMDNTDDVIRYATQCMLGKKTNAKIKLKKDSINKEKRFFMPDNVNTGIVTAANLVEKVKIEDKSEKKLSKDFPTLDNLQYDSMEFSSPSRSDMGDFFEKDSKSVCLDDHQNSRNLQGVLLKETEKMDAFPDKNKDHPLENISLVGSVSLGEKIDSDELRHSSPPALKKRRLTAKPDGTKNNTSSIIRTNAISPEYPVRNQTEECDGLLTPEERKVFLSNYSASETVSIDTIPTFQKGTTYSTIPHSTRNEALLKLFQHLNENSEAIVIQMNRQRCIARGLQSGAVSFEEDVHVIAKEKGLLSKPLQNSQGTDEFETIPSLGCVDLEELDEILGSESDF
ncbi:hypothetical protein HG535_0F02500 [Zygotorulaspora mrakii]|uniref:ATP-dependent DNA helicase n=1 Tax=Zygotorulaspora mrakii TaxID=42260 RepID=A0A7H9B714_ZYGMR|nr:uncharacterized protein HG535_0F02500 [Zygotorulaspora mrakii]QLG73739.1 hypothetical protein HG535_0F02500 [Zygotorulaspora mrakii]